MVLNQNSILKTHLTSFKLTLQTFFILKVHITPYQYGHFLF